MDDLSEKLGAILSDPEAMQEIAALASQLGVDAPGLHSEANRTNTRPPEQKGQNTSADLQGLLNMLGTNSSAPQKPSGDTVTQLMALAPMLGSLKQDDDTTRLLDAMRPFLSEERKVKLDKAKRLIKVMKLMPLLKDLPLFDL
ncbi:MAG: hypothetical protein IJH07_03025 [Ruminococcus sp.]|nr:hypothetical protein [Ruminococcus sp.]